MATIITGNPDGSLSLYHTQGTPQVGRWSVERNGQGHSPDRCWFCTEQRPVIGFVRRSEPGEMTRETYTYRFGVCPICVLNLGQGEDITLYDQE